MTAVPNIGLPILSGGPPQEMVYEQEQETQYAYEAIDSIIGSETSDTLRDELSLSGGTRANILEQLGIVIVEMAKEAADSKSSRDDRIREFIDILNLELPDRVSPLGPTGSNIRTPLMYKSASSLHAFYYQTITGIRPFIKTEPYSHDDTSSANKLEDFYDGFYTEQCPLASLIDKALSSSIAAGFAVLKPCWVYESKMFPSTEVLSPENAEELGYTIPMDAQPGAVAIHKTGRRARVGEVVTERKRIVTKDAPEVHVVDYFDFLISPANCDNVDEAAFVGERTLESVSALRRDAKSGIFDEKAVKKCLAAVSHIDDGHKTEILSDSAVTDNQLDNDLDEPSRVRLSSGRQIELIRGVVRIDLDGDDESEDWYVVVESSTKTVLSCRPYTYSHDYRNYRPSSLFLGQKVFTECQSAIYWRESRRSQTRQSILV